MYEQVEVDLPIDEESELNSLFPNAKMPAIRDDGDVAICESGAIALYLAHKYGGGIPADPSRRALAFQAIFIEAALLAPTIGGVKAALHRGRGFSSPKWSADRAPGR